jgi:hypothetical protein
VRLFPQQVEERRHGVTRFVPVQRHVHRLTLLRCTFIILLRCTIFILLCRDGTQSRPIGSAAPHLAAKWLVSLIFDYGRL